MTNLFFRDRRLLTLAVCLITVAGISSYLVLPRMEDPMLTPRAANVTTAFPGADAERVESQVTEEIEKAIEEVEEIKEVRSFSRTGISLVQIELRDDVYESDNVWSRIRDKIGDARNELPAGTGPPEFDELDVRAFAMIASLKWQQPNRPSYAILRRLASQLEDRLQSVRGTEKTELFGDPDEEIQVSVRADRLASLGLSAASVANQLRASDSKVAAGQMRGDSGDLLLEVGGELDTLQRVAQTPIQYGDSGRFVQLSDVARIDRGIADPPGSISLIDKQPAIAVGVLVRSDYRIDRWAEDAHSALDSFEEQLPTGVGLEVLFSQNEYVSERLSTLRMNLMAGGIAVSIVILFMMGWRSALIVSSALPLSAMMVLTAMRFMETPIHQMSVTGLIIALGLLIDNAIVIVDEVAQKLKSGATAAAAVSESVSHLAVPLFGSTLTTALAFGPIALMPGPAGEFVGSIAVNVIVAIFSSFLLAMTVIPAFAAIGLRPNDDSSTIWWREGFSNRRVSDLYGAMLEFLFRHPWLGVLLGIALPIAGFVQARHLSEQFFPPADRDQIQIELELPAHASLAETVETANRIREQIMQHDRVNEVHWFLGESAPTFYYNVIPMRKGTPRYAQALVQLNSAENSRELIHELQQELDDSYPGSMVLVRQLEQGPPFYAPIEIRVFGPDIETLRDIGDEVRLVLSQTPDVIHTRSELSESLPKIKLKVDEQQARLAGLDHREIAAQLDGVLEGSIGGSILESTEELPIRVRVSNQSRSSISDIVSIDLLPGGSRRLETASYQGIPLSAISRLELEPEIGGIPRLSGRRMNEVQAFITAGVLPAVVLRDFEERFGASGFELPPGYKIIHGGEAAKRNDAIGNLLANVGILLVLMVATLVLSFKSFRIASLVLSVAVLSVGLGLGSLWLWGFSFGFMAIVGTMGLIGVAINDTIVVLAAIRGDPQARAGDIEALCEVVMKSTRHILATSLTTMAGFAPLILGGGGFWPPLAISVAGGVLGATVLALCFIPAAYLLVMCRSER